MPQACRRTNRAWIGAAILAALGTTTGCRAFRCQEISVERLAAARQLSLQGIEAQDRGQWEQAETCFATAIQQAPRDERARAGYAEALWQRGEQQAAIAQMEEAVRLSGDDPERLVQLGSMHLARGESARAIAQADRAIRTNRPLASAWALRGQALVAQGNRTEALAAFHRALSLEAHFPDVQLAIAEIYSQQARPQRALATLQALASNYPPSEVPLDVLVREGLAYRELGRYSEAARSLALATTRGNPSAELWFELARTRVMADDPTAARLAVNAALELEPDHVASLALAQELGTRRGILATAAATTRPLTGSVPPSRY